MVFNVKVLKAVRIEKYSVLESNNRTPNDFNFDQALRNPTLDLLIHIFLWCILLIILRKNLSKRSKILNKNEAYSFSKGHFKKHFGKFL